MKLLRFCFSEKVISEFSLLNPQNITKPLVTYLSKGGLEGRLFLENKEISKSQNSYLTQIIIGV